MKNGNKLNRREFLKKSGTTVAGVGLGTGLLSLSGCGKSFSKDNNLPNIILITADDMGWKDLSCFGNNNIQTKNIDKLANNGVRFTHAFVVSSTCSPSRASLLTGQYPHTNGVTALTHRYKTRALNPFHKILPGILEDRGFNTAIQGKNHVSPYLPTSWYGYNERRTGIGLNDEDWEIKTADESIDYIRENKENRFYLELNFIQNHRIKKGKFFYSSKFPVDPNKIQIPEYMNLPDWPEIREDLAKYYSQTLEMDSVIGEIMAELGRERLTENTLIVFLSDNGAPYPGNKLTLYDRGTGTPLIFHWPKKIKPGESIDSLVSSIDIMPTILEAIGSKIPEKLQGKSFWKQITGQDKDDVREAVFAEMTNHVHYIPTRAARTKKWKYIRNYSNIAFGLDELRDTDWAYKLCELPGHPWLKPRVHEELYYLPDDANEQKNLAEVSKYSTDLKQMRQLLDNHMKETEDPFMGKPFTDDYKKEDYIRKPW